MVIYFLYPKPGDLLFMLQACLFVAVSPSADNLSESMSTLKFGAGARQVELGEAKKNVGRRRTNMMSQQVMPNDMDEAWGVQDI